MRIKAKIVNKNTYHDRYTEILVINVDVCYLLSG